LRSGIIGTRVQTVKIHLRL